MVLLICSVFSPALSWILRFIKLFTNFFRTYLSSRDSVVINHGCLLRWYNCSLICIIISEFCMYIDQEYDCARINRDVALGKYCTTSHLFIYITSGCDRDSYPVLRIENTIPCRSLSIYIVQSPIPAAGYS